MICSWDDIFCTFWFCFEEGKSEESWWKKLTVREIGFVILSEEEEIIAESFYSFIGLPDKRLFPSVSAVYGNTEVSMVYLGPPLDGWNSLKNLHIKTAASKKKRRLSRFNLMIKMNSSYKKNCRTHGKTKSES